MRLYITRDYEPAGGFYSGAIEKTVDLFAEEIRVLDDFPDDIWADLNAGGVILPGSDGTLDEFWFPYFDRAATIWRR